MPRIRTIKPSFFRHGDLQDLETDNPGAHVMLVFAALFGHCDKEGRFLWSPRDLKLDILPFINYDLDASLVLLREAGQIYRYKSGEKYYGFIPTFKEHQRINGKEATDPPKYPEPPENIDSIIIDAPENIGEAMGKQQGRQEGKGREQGKEGKGEAPPEEIQDEEGEEEQNPLGDNLTLPHCTNRTGDISLETKPNKRKSQLPEDWVLPPDGLEWAQNRAREKNVSGIDWDFQAERFKNHHHGNGSKQLNWAATWRTWAMQTVKWAAEAQPQSTGTGEDILAEVMAGTGGAP